MNHTTSHKALISLVTLSLIVSGGINALASHAIPNTHLEVEKLDVGLGQVDPYGLSINYSGQLSINYDGGPSAGLNAVYINASQGGMKVTGKYYGAKAENLYDSINNKYGRTAIGGLVNGNASKNATGYVGYLELDPPPRASNGPSLSPPSNQTNSPFQYNNTIQGPVSFPVLTPITNGNPVAFYTEDTSRFIDVVFAGALRASGAVDFTIGDLSSPQEVSIDGDIMFESNGSHTITTGYLELDPDQYEHDLTPLAGYGIWDSIANTTYANELESPIFTIYNSDANTDQNFSGVAGPQEIIALAQCPTNTHRIACDAWVENNNMVVSAAPFRGVQPLANERCLARARDVSGSPTELYVQATCFAPSLPAH